jgi:hypothetical protein
MRLLLLGIIPLFAADSVRVAVDPERGLDYSEH